MTDYSGLVARLRTGTSRTADEAASAIEAQRERIERLERLLSYATKHSSLRDAFPPEFIEDARAALEAKS